MAELAPVDNGVVDIRAASTRLGEDPELLAKVLQVYKPHCRYLKSASVSVRNGRCVARGEFAIDIPCYIDDTGHFNAVEFNICYNQLAYFAVAKVVKEQALPAFEGWGMDDFWERQLPSILITAFRAIFRSQIDSDAFHGEITFATFARSTIREPVLFIDSTTRYWDESGGRADGETKLAILDPPREDATAEPQA
jgi:hypothetical protein